MVTENMSFSENQRQANKYLVEQTEQLEKQVKKLYMLIILILQIQML